MKSVMRGTYKPETRQIFSRPQTAKLCSFKKLSQILEGKYISMQNKASKTAVPRSSDERKRQLLHQTQPRLVKKARNPSVDNCRGTKQKTQLVMVYDFQKLKKQGEIKFQKIVEKQNTFVPYSRQQNYFSTLSQPSITLKKCKKSKKRTQESKQKQISCTQVIDCWKNGVEEDLHFSSLFKKTWNFQVNPGSCL